MGSRISNTHEKGTHNMNITARGLRGAIEYALAKYGEDTPNSVAYYVVDDIECNVVRHALLAPLYHAYCTIDELDNGDIVVWFKQEGYLIRKSVRQLAWDMNADMRFWEGVYGEGYWQ